MTLARKEGCEPEWLACKKVRYFVLAIIPFCRQIDFRFIAIMKKFLTCLCLLPFCFLFTARAEMPAATTTATPDAAPAHVPPLPPPSTSSSMIQYTNAPAPDDVDPAKKAAIIKMMELTGRVKMTQMVMEQMISRFKMQNSRVSPEFWDRFEKEVNVQGLVEKMIPLYAKYYSLDDLKAINAFYETPAGQRMIATMPLIMHDSMQIGQDWGRDLSFRLLAELKAEKQKAQAAADAAAATSTNSTSSSAPSTNAAPVSAPAPTPGTCTRDVSSGSTGGGSRVRACDARAAGLSGSGSTRLLFLTEWMFG